MCQPGRPRPQGESQPGCSSVEGFHSTKSGHVLFHTLSYGDYGKLSGRDEQALMAGARVEVAPIRS